MDAPWTIMTWNVRYFGHGSRGLRSSDRWMRRTVRALGSVETLPDVLALQEVETTSLRSGWGGGDQVDRLLALLNGEMERRGRPVRYRSLYFPAHRYGLEGGPALYTTGLAILVAGSVLVEAHNAGAPHEVTHVRLPWARALKQRRVVAHARLRRSGKDETVDVFNTHLSLPAFLEVGPHRVAERMGHGSNQLAEIGAVLDFVDARREGSHALLLGDFNAAPGSPVHRAVLGRGGWRDAFSEHVAPRATARFLNRRMHIDHVFSSPSIDWTTIAPHGVDDPDSPFHGLSDHSPKIGRFKVG